MKSLPATFKYLLWPGLMLLTAGLVVGLLNGWTAVAVGLLVVGAIAIVGAIASGSYSGFWQQRSTLAGTNAVVSVVSVLVILALVNFLGVRYSWRADLSEGQQLSLSPASQQVVADLAQPTELLLFSQLPDASERQLLENYQRYNSDFTYRYVDPAADPQLVRELNVQTGDEAFLRAGDRTIPVQRPAPQAPLTERALTNKLAQLSQDQTATIYFLQGHGEYDISGQQAGYFEAVTRLREQNYTVEPLNLAETSKIPADADVLVVGGARQKLFDAEVKAVQDYLDADGSLFVLIDPQVDPGLNNLLSQWGVVPEDAIVIDISTAGGGQLVGQGPEVVLVSEYGVHPITEAFGEGRSFYPISRPLNITEVADVQETPLLLTAQSTQVQPLQAGTERITVAPTQEPQGPFVIGAALTRPPLVAAAGSPGKDTAKAAGEVAEADIANGAAIEEKPPEDAAAGESASAGEAANKEDSTGEDADLPDLPLDGSAEAKDPAAEESRLVVIGNSSFAIDGLFSQQLNGDVFLNSITWLSKIDNPTLSIQPKEITNRRFEMTVQQQILLTLLALIIFPLAGLIGSGVLWLRRR